MITKNRKTIATILIVVVSIVLFVVFMYVNAINENHIPEFTSILFAIFPALAINAIWYRKAQKK
ncbi:hypothetical protein [Lutibacter sp.]|uniref:hypothetical protein n=1 Tax=Lutibacter sp. TaxID=1925666 RepID=UPI00356149C3